MRHILLSVTTACSLAVASQALAQTFVAGDTIRFERSGSMFLDAANNRLYVTQSPFDPYNAGALVVNLSTNKFSGRLSVDPKIQSVNSITFAPEFGKGYTSNGEERTVSVFDLQTFAADKEIVVKDRAGRIVYDPASKKVFVVSRKEIFVIDAATGTLSPTSIPVGDRVSFAEVDGKGKLYATIGDPGTGTVAIIDTKTAKETGRIKLEKCGAPDRLEVDAATGHLLVNCSNRAVVVSDPSADKILGTVSARSVVSRMASTGAGFLAPTGNDDALMVVSKDPAGAYAVGGAAAITLKGLRVNDVRFNPITKKLYVAASGAAGKDFRVIVFDVK